MFSRDNKRAVRRKYKKAGSKHDKKECVFESRRSSFSETIAQWLVRRGTLMRSSDPSTSSTTPSHTARSDMRVVFWPNSRRVNMLTPPIAECPINDCLRRIKQPRACSHGAKCDLRRSVASLIELI